jgi:tetratricopeptide (TPR) repeat protein
MISTKLLPKGTEQDLYHWVEFFKGTDPIRLSRRQKTLEILENKLTDTMQKGDPAAIKSAEEKLAYCRQNEGETLLALGNAELAVQKLLRAWDYWNKINAPEATTDLPMQQLLTAYLRARRYSDGVKFATEILAHPNGNQYMPTLARIIKKEVDRLLESREARDRESAVDLLNQMATIPFNEDYKIQLNSWKEGIKRASGSGGNIRIRPIAGLEEKLVLSDSLA